VVWCSRTAASALVVAGAALIALRLIILVVARSAKVGKDGLRLVFRRAVVARAALVALVVIILVVAAAAKVTGNGSLEESEASHCMCVCV
jgi:hypothetical protein